MIYVDQIQYLANLIHITFKDEIKTSFTQQALNNIIERRRFSKKIYKEAYQLIKHNDYNIKLIGCYSDKIRFFEDLMYILYADGQLNDYEKQIIIILVRELGLTIDQIKLIIRQTMRTSDFYAICPKCQKSILKYKPCPWCNNEQDIKNNEPIIKIGNMFNKQIGDKKNEERNEQTVFSYPDKGIVIEFAKSKNTVFYDALKIANLGAKVNKVSHDNKTWFMAYWPFINIFETLPLIEKLQSIREKKCIIDGIIMDWEHIYGFFWCYQNHKKSHNPDEYCLGIRQNKLFLWGCIHCKLPWGQWNDWVDCGYYSDKEKFIIEKKKILDIIQKNLRNFKYCPVVDFKLMQVITNALPEQINVINESSNKNSISPHNFLEAINIIKKVAQQYNINN